MRTRIDVFVLTYRRPGLLRDLLESLQRQTIDPDLSVRIIVVDNDADESAKATVASMAAQGPLPILYEREPRRGIACARNRCLALFDADWLAFIDDDEIAVEDWLKQLVRTAIQYRADIVLGPVPSALPPTTPRWIIRGGFFDRQRFATGTELRGHGGAGNILLSGDLLRRAGRGFDLAFNLTGGEDSEFIGFLESIGARTVYCNEAVATETVPAQRANLYWLLRRHFRGGQDYARRLLKNLSPTERIAWFVQRITYILVVFPGIFLLLPFRVHKAAWCLLKLSSNCGHLSALLNRYYEEYRDVDYKNSCNN